MRVSARPAFAWRVVLPVALVQLLVLLAFANRYGYHRDELYFRVAARHPSVAYEDQGALTPLLGRLSEALFGETPRGLRAISAVLASIVVVVIALCARELGTRTVGQLVAAVAAAISGYLLAVGHLLTTSTLDALVWTTTLLLVARILAGGDERLWVVVGVVFAVGLENKALPLLLAVALAVGLALDRRLGVAVRSRWLWAGVLLALVGWLPYLAWQARHGWPQLELAGDIRHDEAGESRATLIPLQILLVGPLLAPLLGVGLWGLLRDRPLRPWRSLGYAYLALLVVVFVTAGKPYYAAPFLLFVLAPGATLVERWLVTPLRRVALASALVVSAVVSALVVLPVLPADTIGGTPVADLNEDAVETIGWPEFARTVGDVYGRLPAAEQRAAVVLAANYGEAGALSLYGPALGLPRVYSGHNALARFGTPPDDAGPVIVVGYDDPSVDFSGCERAATIDNGADVDNEEQGGGVFVCAKPRAPWTALWHELEHLDA
jgi:4-amino-4-deoxy-L-arabinose transferase-like glycosyltransferase